MDKLKLDFVVKASEDIKTNIIFVTKITDSDGRTFAMPDKFKLQPVRLHEAQTQIFQKVGYITKETIGVGIYETGDEGSLL